MLSAARSEVEESVKEGSAAAESGHGCLSSLLSASAGGSVLRDRFGAF